MPTWITREQVREMVTRGAQLVDVLSAEDHAESHLPGALNIPLRDLGRVAPARLRRDRPVITYCHDLE